MKLARNSFYSLLGTALPTLLSIATIPFFIAQIGAERYGALAIAWLVLGYFGAADFGVGRAVTQRIATMRGETKDSDASADLPAMACTVWSALASMAVFGLAGAGVLFAFALWYFAGPFEVTPGVRGEILSAVWLIALCNPLVTISGVFSGALMGIERFKLVSACNMFSSSALMLFPLGAAYWISTDLQTLVLAALLARLLGMLVLAGGVWLTFLKGQAFCVSRAELRRLTGFGAWIMVTAIVGPLMVLSDRFIIGVVADAVAVAAYAIPFQIASRTLMFPAAITQALFPRFSAVDQLKSFELCQSFVLFVGLVFAPLIIVLTCLAGPLMQLWLGDALDPRSVLVAHLVLAGIWFNAIANIPFAFIQARGNPRFTGLLHLAELPVYAALLFLLGGKFGLAGFAAAFALRCAIDCGALLQRAGAATRHIVPRLAAPAVLILTAYAVAFVQLDLISLLGATALLAGLSIALVVILSPVEIRVRIAQVPGLPRLLSSLLLLSGR